MYVINNLRCNVNSTLEAKCHISSPKIIVDSLWKRYHIQSLFTQEVGCFLRTIATENHKAVKLQFVVVLLHGLNFIKTVLIRFSDGLKRCSGTT